MQKYIFFLCNHSMLRKNHNFARRNTVEFNNAREAVKWISCQDDRQLV